MDLTGLVAVARNHCDFRSKQTAIVCQLILLLKIRNFYRRILINGLYVSFILPFQAHSSVGRQQIGLEGERTSDGSGWTGKEKNFRVSYMIRLWMDG